MPFFGPLFMLCVRIYFLFFLYVDRKGLFLRWSTNVVVLFEYFKEKKEEDRPDRIICWRVRIDSSLVFCLDSVFLRHAQAFRFFRDSSLVAAVLFYRKKIVSKKKMRVWYCHHVFSRRFLVRTQQYVRVPGIVIFPFLKR